LVQRYNGTLTHVTGEGFTALFGAPVAQEDHARRAVLAALLLRQHLGELPLPGALRYESNLAVRIGIHTGQVVVGPLPQAPSHLYTAGGSTARLAMLQQQRATPGTILISAATQQLVQEEAQAAADGTIAVDGIPSPVSVYAVQGLVPRRAGVVGHGTRHQSPFVGREREVALLHARLTQAAQGRGQVVGISGESGMGKSRLLEEFRRSLTEQPVTSYIGHCLPYGQTTPYLLVRELLRQCCGLMEMDDAAAITSKVHQYLCETGLAPEEEVPWLLQLLDVPGASTHLAQFDSQARKTRTFALSYHIILHTCHRQPLILVVENLQWIDATSEAWLAALVEHLTGASLLLLASYRPGYRPPWLEQSMATQVALSGLLPQESLAVVHAVPRPVPLPHHLAQEIVAKAAGNPIFLEELAWTVATHDDRHTALTLPDTVQAVLAARVDRLPPAAKRLLQIAAVIGIEVPVPLLHAVVEVPEEALQRDLALLQATEFLYEMRLFPVREYAFKHTLTHEVAYGSLLHERQRAVHTRIVEVLEAQHSEHLSEYVERLVHHAVRGEVWEKALRYCRQAGAKAFARSANREAVAYCEQALGSLRHLPPCRDTLEQAIDLRFDLHNALVLLEESERSADHLHEAETLAKRLGDQRQLARAAFYLSEYCRQMGDQTGALAAGQRALTLATALGECGLQAAMHFRQGQVYINLGEYRQALDCFGHSLALLHGEPIGERFGLPGVLAVLSRAWTARCLAELGEFDEGMAYGEEAIRIAVAVDHPFSRIDACYNVGYLYLRKGDLHTAIRRLEESLRVGRAADIRLLFVNVASTLGAAYALSGRSAEALPLLEQAVKQAVATNFRRSRQNASLSEAYMRAGHLEEGRRHVRQALERARAHRERGHEAYALWLLGELVAHDDSPQAAPAEAHYFQALTLAEELGMHPLQAHCHRGLGTLYAATGQQEQARAALAAAIDLYHAMDMTFWLPQVEEALVQMEAR
jgi:tetratricopeptide (TPR) repeat protein